MEDVTMNSEEIIAEIRQYESELEGILSRFSHGREGIHINRGDDPLLRQVVRELVDLFNDALGSNSYSSQIIKDFNEGVANYFKTPSYKSVENILAIVRAAITRFSRSPELLDSKKAQDNLKQRENVFIMPVRSSKENWEAIKSEYGISKRDFGKKINFVSDSFKREVIFRDVEHAFVLASEGFAKPAVILAGGVIEELLRLYLKHKNIAAAGNTFNEYIKACKQNKLLQTGIGKLSDSAREFRNFVHLSKESAKKHSITKAAAKGAVSSIFIIANDL